MLLLMAHVSLLAVVFPRILPTYIYIFLAWRANPAPFPIQLPIHTHLVAPALPFTISTRPACLPHAPSKTRDRKNCISKSSSCCGLLLLLPPPWPLTCILLRLPSRYIFLFLPARRNITIIQVINTTDRLPLYGGRVRVHISLGCLHSEFLTRCVACWQGLWIESNTSTKSRL